MVNYGHLTSHSLPEEWLHMSCISAETQAWAMPLILTFKKGRKEHAETRREWMPGGPPTLEKVVFGVHVRVVRDDIKGGAPSHHLKHEDAQRPPVHAEP